MGQTSAINHWPRGVSGSPRHWTPDRPGNCREMGLMSFDNEAFYSSDASTNGLEIECMLMSAPVCCFGETAVSGIPFLVQKDDYNSNETVATLWTFFELQRTDPSKRRDFKKGDETTPTQINGNTQPNTLPALRMSLWYNEPHKHSHRRNISVPDST